MDHSARTNPNLLGKEADVALNPTYHDGTPRKTWDELESLRQWSWSRPPSPNTQIGGE